MPACPWVQGYNEFSLLSLSCSDYLSLPSVGIQIKNRLRGENVSLSLPSQRVDRWADAFHVFFNWIGEYFREVSTYYV